MNQWQAISIKFIALSIISMIALMPAGLTFGQAIFTALIITGVLYALGDLVVLPAFGNWTGVVADSGLALVIAWMAPAFLGIPAGIGFTAAFMFAIGVGVFEFFFHGFLQREVLPQRQTAGSPAVSEREDQRNAQPIAPERPVIESEPEEDAGTDEDRPGPGSKRSEL